MEMKQNNTRLSEEMTKLIITLLSKRHGVYLPTIGSLSLASEKGAQSITLSKEKSHRSILTEIADKGNCSKEQALKLYNKWLEEIRKENTLTIAEIGVVELSKSGNTFTIDESLLERLNTPTKAEAEVKVEAKTKTKTKTKTKAETTAPKQPNGKKGLVSWIIVTLLLVAGIGAILVSSLDDTEKETIAPIEPTVVEAEVIVEEILEEPAIVPTPGAITIDRNLLKSKARYASTAEALEIFESSFTSDDEMTQNYRVVCGVLSTKANAGRLLLDAELLTSKVSAMGATPRIYPRGEGYMVTLFEASTFRECVEFIQEYGASLYDNCWVYNDRKMKI